MLSSLKSFPPRLRGSLLPDHSTLSHVAHFHLALCLDEVNIDPSQMPATIRGIGSFSVILMGFQMSLVGCVGSILRRLWLVAGISSGIWKIISLPNVA